MKAWSVFSLVAVCAISPLVFSACPSPSGSSAGGGTNGIFEKTGGAIYGYTEGDTNSNIVESNNGGSAAYIYFNSTYKALKETTAGPEDDLLFDARTSPPIISGAWDEE